MKQPEALRLADELDVGDFDVLTNYAAAAELRRLHEANQAMLEALKCVKERLATSPIYVMYASEVFDSYYESIINNAIAKGEQQ